MPYRRYRRYTRKRKYVPKKKGTNWWGYARKGLSLARQVWKLKGLVNSEIFKHDVPISGDIPNTWTVNSLTSITQGDSYALRTGNSIYVRSVNWKGRVSFTASSGGLLSQVIRMVVFIDTQQQTDAVPNPADIFSANTIQTHLNPLTVGRYKILHNRLVVVDSVGQLEKCFEINIPMRHHVRYNGANSGDLQKGCIYTALLSTAPANFPTITSECRVSYHDN